MNPTLDEIIATLPLKNDFERSHLKNWLRLFVHDDTVVSTLAEIHVALLEDPTLVDDVFSWDEIAARGRA